MKNKRKIIFVIYSLKVGGAERVISHMANYWSRASHEISIIIISDEEPFYHLDKGVKLIPLELAKASTVFLDAFFNNLKRIKKLRKQLKLLHPDIVISFINTANVLTLLSTRNTGIPVIISERSNPWKVQANKVWQTLMHITYPYANALILQTKEYKKAYTQNLQQRIRVIPNGVHHVETNATLSKSQQPITIISVGRLSPVKGMDILITAFASIKDTFPEIRLLILGDGPSQQELQGLCKKLGAEDRVIFTGKVNNPIQYVQQADIFVLASRFEGFPNALCEAMACGLPVISTESSPAIREIIREQVDGLIVPVESPKQLAKSLEALIVNDEKRRQMGKKASEIVERFNFEKIMRKWEEVIEDVIQHT
jgi:GalNAc-alpha-(1->4)-GalNAc-alpha-(1->3)-diNAcBac-PP-undecaprenol alpha-1,4-N-acetyl-D-galactosaminyltransferase